jgi:hypothetical protein
MLTSTLTSEISRSVGNVKVLDAVARSAIAFGTFVDATVVQDAAPVGT